MQSHAIACNELHVVPACWLFCCGRLPTWHCACRVSLGRHLLSGDEWSYDVWRANHMQKWTTYRECASLHVAPLHLPVRSAAPPLLLLPAWWWGHRDQLQLGEPDWDYAHFLQQHLADYLVMTQRFMDECFASDGGQQQQQQ